VATSCYAATIALAGALIAAMSARLRTAPALATPNASAGDLGRPVLRALLVVAVFATSVPVSLASPTAAKCWWLPAIPARPLFRDPPVPEGAETSAARVS
jgi:hypothetical protein